MGTINEPGITVASGPMLDRLGKHQFYKKVLHHKLDSVFAWFVNCYLENKMTINLILANFRGFERTILAAYRWLSDNYEPGDCIFLFGQSRLALSLMCTDSYLRVPRVFWRSISSSRSFSHDRQGSSYAIWVVIYNCNNAEYSFALYAAETKCKYLGTFANFKLYI